jgi:c-di-GMP-binding flagellar brake protein YcgR
MAAIIIMMEETVSRIQRRNNPRADLQETYGKLNSFIEVSIC